MTPGPTWTVQVVGSFVLWVVWNMDENFIKTGPSKTNPRAIILFTLIYIPAIQEIWFSNNNFGYTRGFTLRHIQMEVWVTLKCYRQCASDYFLVILIMRKQNFDSRKSTWTHNTMKDSMTGPVLIGLFIWNPSPNHFRNFSISQNIYKKDIFFHVVFPLYVDCCNSSVFFPLFYFFLFIFFRGDVNCLRSQVQCGSFRKSSWKKFFPPNLSYAHFKTAYSFFFLPHCSCLECFEKTSSSHAFSCKQEAKSSCAYWEEVTSLYI